MKGDATGDKNRNICYSDSDDEISLYVACESDFYLDQTECDGAQRYLKQISHNDAMDARQRRLCHTDSTTADAFDDSTTMAPFGKYDLGPVNIEDK